MDGRTEPGFGLGLGTAGKTTNYYYGNTTKSCENVNQLVDREREKHTTNKHKSFPGERQTGGREREPEPETGSLKDDALCVKGATPVRMAHKDIYVDI